MFLAPPSPRPRAEGSWTLSLIVVTLGACFDAPPIGEAAEGSTGVGLPSGPTSGPAATDGLPTTTSPPDQTTTSSSPTTTSTTTSVGSGGDPSATDTGVPGSGTGASDPTGSDTGTSTEVRCATPVSLGAFATVGQTHDVVVRGTTAYLVEGLRGVHILDVTDPTAIAQIDVFDQPNPRSLQVVSGRAYVGNTNGLNVVDVSNPTFPQALGGFGLPNGLLVGGVAVDGDVVYVTDEGNLDPCDCGLHVLDASDPSSIAEIGFVPMGDRQWTIELTDGFAFVAADADGVAVIDRVTEAVVASLPPPSFSSVYDIQLVDDLLFITMGFEGLGIADVSDPRNPVMLDTSGEPVDMYPQTGVVSFQLGLGTFGNQAWIGSSAGLQIFDVSDPTDIVTLIDDDMFGNVSEVVVENDIAYLSSWDGGLQVLGWPACD